MCERGFERCSFSLGSFRVSIRVSILSIDVIKCKSIDPVLIAKVKVGYTPFRVFIRDHHHLLACMSPRIHGLGL